jgi:hypothetical protein
MCRAPGPLSTKGIMPRSSAPTLRQIYLKWIEDQIEDYKDGISRSDLLRLADEAVDDLRVTGGGQYQLTEVLLCTAVDRKIFSLLKLPGFRTWSWHRRSAAPLDLRGESAESEVSDEEIGVPHASLRP